MIKIKIYTIPDCIYCEEVKRFLKDKKIKFREIKVMQNKEYAKEMIIKSRQKNVPVLEMDSNIIIRKDKEGSKEVIEKIKKILDKR